MASAFMFREKGEKDGHYLASDCFSLFSSFSLLLGMSPSFFCVVESRNV